MRLSICAPSTSSDLTGATCASSRFTERRRLLAKLVHKPRAGLLLNAQFEDDGALVFEHACLLLTWRCFVPETRPTDYAEVRSACRKVAMRGVGLQGGRSGRCCGGYGLSTRSIPG
jgi:hypothetical protein